MLKNIDRYARPNARALAVGQIHRLPKDNPGENPPRWAPVRMESWEIIAFPGGGQFGPYRLNPNLRHCAVVRRLKDGRVETVAQWHLTKWQDD